MANGQKAIGQIPLVKFEKKKMDNAEINLEYNLESLLPAVSFEEIHKFEKKISDYFEQKIKLPDELIQQLLHFHGGIPGKQCFQTPDCKIRMICRFCNIFEPLGDERLPTPPIPSWRPGGASDIRIDYAIDFLLAKFDYSDRLYESGTLFLAIDVFLASFDFSDRLYESEIQFLPIAVIDTDGHNAREKSEMDLLCLDYRKPGEPPVVTWNFELSWYDPEQVVRVADTFREFLPILYKRPDNFPVTNDCEYF